MSFNLTENEEEFVFESLKEFFEFKREELDREKEFRNSVVQDRIKEKRLKKSLQRKLSKLNLSEENIQRIKDKLSFTESSLQLNLLWLEQSESVLKKLKHDFVNLDNFIFDLSTRRKHE